MPFKKRLIWELRQVKGLYYSRIGCKAQILAMNWLVEGVQGKLTR